MNPKIGSQRPPAPLRWGLSPASVKIGGKSTGVAWYHIIPFSLLRTVWNQLVDQQINTQLPEARVAIRQYLVLADARLQNVDALVDRIRAENTTQRRAGHNNLQPLTVVEADQLASVAAWPAWDVVEGPTPRSDDPGDQLDRFTVGLLPAEIAQMKALEHLFSAFKQFANAGPGSGASGLSTLSHELAIERSNVARELPIRLRAEMWVEDGTKWRKNRSAD